MKKIIFILVGIIVFLIILFFSFPHILNLFARDIPPIDDSDLRLTEVPVPPREENAFYDLEDLKVVLANGDIEIINGMLAGGAWDENAAGRILSANTSTLTVFDGMAKKPVFQNPSYASPEKVSILTPFISMNGIISTAKISAIKAIGLAREGNGAAAFDEAVKSLEIGQKIENSQDAMIEYLVALTLKKIGLDALTVMAPLNNIPPEKVKMLENFRENRKWVATALKIDYRMQIEAIDSVASGNNINTDTPELLSVENNFYFQPNATKKYLAEYIRANISMAEKPCDQIVDIPIDLQIPKSKKEYVKLFFTKNALGKILTDILAVSLSGPSKKSCEIDSKILSVEELIK